MYQNYGYYFCMNYGWMEAEPFQLLDCGVEYRQEETYDYDNRERTEFGGYLFQYTMGGCGYFETEQKTWKLEPGMAFLIPCPDESRYYLRDEDGERWEYFFVHFTGTSAGHLIEEVRKRTDAVMKLSENSEAVCCFFVEFEAMRHGKQYRRYEAGEWVYHFLVTLLREIETPHKNESRCVNEALSWMQRNYASQKNLSDMCLELGVTLPHLTRQFHKEQGLTPEKYLMNLKLQQAVNLLANTTWKVHKIAAACGFSCGNYFTKVFHRRFHMAPTEYREYIGSHQ